MDCPTETLFDNEPSAPGRGMFVVGASLVAYATAFTWLSRRTASGAIDVDTAAFWLVGFSVPAGLIYLLGLRSSTSRMAQMALPSIITVGIAMRAIVMISPPSLEDDFYRYLWDGAVTAHGQSPYRYSPTQVLWGSIGAESIPRPFVQLADEAGPILERVNHPELTTIYPPVAQLAFAASHLLAPWSTDSWRFVLLFADIATLVILLRFISLMGVPSAAVAWYWWNPILLRETYGGAHMDVLVLPFVMAAILLATKRRFTVAMFLLALGGGVKLWPIMLAPIILRPLLGAPTRLVAALATFLITTAAVWLPVIPDGFGPYSGFFAYATGWENNAGAFRVVHGFAQRILALTGAPDVLLAEPIARIAVGACLLTWIGWQIWRPIDDVRDVPRRCGWVVAALFLLSPTQFPWYFLWFLPFLAISPSVPLLSYSALLPLYYVHIRYHPAIVWLEHGLVWMLLIGESLAARFMPHVSSPVLPPPSPEPSH